MLTTDQINDLHHLYSAERWPIRKIEQHLRMSWRTIKKYLEAPAQTPATGVSTFFCNFPPVHALYVGQALSPATGVSTFAQAAAPRTSCFSVNLTSNSFRSSGCSSTSLRNRVTRSRQDGR